MNKLFGDPRIDNIRAESQRLAGLARKLCDGALAPEEEDRLPWHDASFVRAVAGMMRGTVDELQRHRARFKALREVFGPEKDHRL